MWHQVRTLGGRLSFLLNKMQSDEESRVILKEESKKTEAQVRYSSYSLFVFGIVLLDNASRVPYFACIL